LAGAGFVVRDAAFNRRKVKSAEYVVATALTDYVGVRSTYRLFFPLPLGVELTSPHQPPDLSADDHFNAKQLHEVMRTGRIDELLHYYPHLAPRLTSFEHGDEDEAESAGGDTDEGGEGGVDVHTLSGQVEEAYAAIRHHTADKSAFGRRANEHWFCATLIDIRNRQLDDAARASEKGRGDEARAVYVSAREYYAVMPAFLFDKFMRSRVRRLASIHKQRTAGSRSQRGK
jgi:hypothetical protein